MLTAFQIVLVNNYNVQTIMLTNIVTVHVTEPGHRELLTMMSDAIWSHLATMNELIVA